MSWLIKSFIRGLKNSICKLRKTPDYVWFVLEGNYPDIKAPRGNFLQRCLSPPKPSLQELCEVFERIAKDPRTKGIILHLEQLTMSFAKLQTLRDAIKSLQTQGKEVIVWAKNFDTNSYYLATQADKIYLQPGGRIGPLGLRQDQVFLAEALKWCGLQMDAVQISPYKSAMDRFTRVSMTQEVKEMANWMMESNFEQIIQAIAQGRNISLDQAISLVDLSPYTHQDAAGKGVVDEVLNEEDLTKLGKIATWKQASKALPVPPVPRKGEYIALIRIQGSIVDGHSKSPNFKPPLPIPLLFGNQAGDLTVVQAARKALKDKRAKGVLVYIDSGGGSATSSEAMHSALKKLATQKPVVAMMGSVAASGGYYVAAPAQWIVAQPGTVTGSIGVLTGKLVNSGMLEKLLLHRETLSKGESVNLEAPNQPFSPQERQQVLDFITNTYDLFLQRVAQGRNLEKEYIDKVGGGRVWTGAQALEHKLVDELGGLRTALNKIHQMTKAKRDLPLREITIKKQSLAPMDPLTSVQYALESAKLLQDCKALTLCPLWQEND